MFNLSLHLQFIGEILFVLLHLLPECVHQGAILGLDLVKLEVVLCLDKLKFVPILFLASLLILIYGLSHLLFEAGVRFTLHLVDNKLLLGDSVLQISNEQLVFILLRQDTR